MDQNPARSKRKVDVEPTVRAPRLKRQHVEEKLPKQQRVGNFRSYYTYRLGQKHQGALEQDPRLSALNKKWFEGKRGLDVGCNSGEFTITIAKRLVPSYLLGVDVDPQLISRARGHLKDILRQEQIEKAFSEIPAVQCIEQKSKRGEIETVPGDSGEAASDVVEAKQEVTTEKDTCMKMKDEDVFTNSMPLSFRFWKPSVQGQGTASRAIGKAAVGSVFPMNVIFKREDIVLDTHAGKDYDFITCFSVTKWIHLFHGDEGVKKVFAKIYELLTPGGRLIVEPQPWKSYHKRKFTSDVTAANYPKIQLRPKDFPKYLVDIVGFRSCELLEVCQTSSNGFRRPVYVAQK
uniref:RNA methyltransferase n=1 Tax=Peronospora matthiolae TaxID=2874970 RepID=A0AAV1U1X2_9STRA